MSISFRSNGTLLISLILIGQFVFALMSSVYTAPRYEGRIYATIGVELGRSPSDLHKLNEAAHYFGQTIIGWTKFPNFAANLKEKTGLPKDASLSAHMQERQNIIFTVTSSQSIEQAQLFEVKNYLQSKLIEYNESSSTGFTLSNLDYEGLNVTRGYLGGAGVVLFFCVVLWLGRLYLKQTY